MKNSYHNQLLGILWLQKKTCESIFSSIIVIIIVSGEAEEANV